MLLRCSENQPHCDSFSVTMTASPPQHAQALSSSGPQRPLQAWFSSCLHPPTPTVPNPPSLRNSSVRSNLQKFCRTELPPGGGSSYSLTGEGQCSLGCDSGLLEKPLVPIQRQAAGSEPLVSSRNSISASCLVQTLQMHFQSQTVRKAQPWGRAGQLCFLIGSLPGSAPL